MSDTPYNYFASHEPNMTLRNSLPFAAGSEEEAAVAWMTTVHEIFPDSQDTQVVFVAPAPIAPTSSCWKSFVVIRNDRGEFMAIPFGATIH